MIDFKLCLKCFASQCLFTDFRSIVSVHWSVFIGLATKVGDSMFASHSADIMAIYIYIYILLRIL